jgi:HPr kinase/phosphorylase
MESVAVRELGERLAVECRLRLVTDDVDTKTPIATAYVSLPGLLLAGYDHGFHADRVQILGEAELSYLESLAGEERETALVRLCTAPVPCVVVANGGKAPERLIELGNERGIPVFESELPSHALARRMVGRLEDLLAPSETLHGTLLDVYGVGLFFTGKSGTGKSECGLDLVEKGHRLVADDVVHVVRTLQGHVIGFGNDLLRHFMEIRGVGIVDVRAMYGIRAIRQRKRIEVEVRLVTWSELDDYERLGIEDTTTEILGVEIPQVTLPLVPGKNITVISEVIALNHLLKLRGKHPAKEFDERLRRLASGRPAVDEAFRGDSE